MKPTESNAALRFLSHFGDETETSVDQNNLLPIEKNYTTVVDTDESTNESSKILPLSDAAYDRLLLFVGGNNDEREKSHSSPLNSLTSQEEEWKFQAQTLFCGEDSEGFFTVVHQSNLRRIPFGRKPQ